MMTVNEVSRLTGVSIRALQYYDRIGLLRPAGRTEAGYRLYDDAALETLQQILLFRELQFPLKEIREIITSPDFDRTKALKQQIRLLTLRKEHLEDLITLAENIEAGGKKTMDFKAFDTGKLDEYARQAKAEWGNTDAYREYEEKTKNWKTDDYNAFAKDFMQIFAEFGEIKDLGPDSPEAQVQVKKLQEYITGHMYHCTDEILKGLSYLYDGGGEFSANIDAAGGKGTGEFAAKAIRIYCAGKNE